MAIQDTKKEIRKYNIDKPTQVIQMAKILKDYIIKNNLYVEIAGRNYVMVEGWQFAGGLLGLFPKVVEVKDLGDNKWLAHVEIIDKKSGSVVGSGYALCSKSELKKKAFDEYAILSMAQTRAIGKAYRNLIGWIMKAAGYEATPAEEMKTIKINEKEGKSKSIDIQQSIEIIRNTKDKKTLVDLKEKITKSKAYKETQKAVLLKAIEESLELCE